MTRVLPAAAGAVIALSLAAAAHGSPVARPGPERACFDSRDWSGWSAPGDGDVLYLRVGARTVYRVELTPGSHVRKMADNFLVNHVRGSNWICSPLDLDLVLSDHVGFRQPLIARSLRKLDPAEVAALPPKDRP